MDGWMDECLWEHGLKGRGMDRMTPYYLPTFKKAILIHVAIDVDVLASCQRKLCFWILIGALKGVVAVGGGTEEEEEESDLHSTSMSRLLSPTALSLYGWRLGCGCPPLAKHSPHCTHLGPTRL